MIYVYEENVDTYDAIENKSKWINDLLTQARKKLEEANADPNWHPDPRMREARERLSRLDGQG